MCLAPRYMSGPIAAPLMDCRNTASLPDTPWALTSAVSTPATRMRTRPRTRTAAGLSATFVFPVAVIARCIERLPGCEDVSWILRLRRLQQLLAGLDLLLRELHPVALVNRAVAHEDQVA